MAQYKGKGADAMDGIAKDLHIVGDIEIRIRGWARHIIVTEEERIPLKKGLSMRNSPTQDQ
jgi:hypothetical protein